MTDEEANQIITVIESHWQPWKIEGETLRQWIYSLRRFEFWPSKCAINNLYFEWKKAGHPPPGLIFAVLRKTQKKDEEQTKNEPVLLFEIVRMVNDRGMKFYRNRSTIPEREAVEKESAAMRERFDGLYGGEHYVIRHWEPIPF